MSDFAGTVVAFDREVGLGQIDVGHRRIVDFHCIEIADGTRDIAVGTQVSFRLVPKLGRYEAADIRPV